MQSAPIDRYGKATMSARRILYSVASIRQARPLPFQVFQNFRTLPPSNRNYLLAAVAAHHNAIHAHNWWGATSKLTKRWFYRVPKEIVQMLWLYARKARDVYGKSITAQFFDIVRLYLRNGVAADDYYLGGLAGLNRSEQDQMVPYWIFRDANMFCLGVDKTHESIERICSKHRLAEHVLASGHRAPKMLALLKPDDTEGAKSILAPQTSFFAKPDRGSKGQHAERWVKDGDTFYLARQDLRVPKDKIIDHMQRRCREIGKPLLLQELIENNEAIQKWAGKAFATARIDTHRTPDGSVTVGRGIMRIPADQHSSVDNISSGGTGFSLNSQSGIMGPGYMDLCFGPANFTSRSPATGEVLTGQKVPGWEEACATVLELHKSVENAHAIGWDIGFSPDGPVVVEANIPNGLHIIDQVALGGFFNTHTADCMAQCIASRLAETQPTGSRLMVGAEYGENA